MSVTLSIVTCGPQLEIALSGPPLIVTSVVRLGGVTRRSSLVLAANRTRTDLVAPATGRSETIRNDKGHIVSVPGFVS